MSYALALLSWVITIAAIALLGDMLSLWDVVTWL